jgi:hypothetical protein
MGFKNNFICKRLENASYENRISILATICLTILAAGNYLSQHSSNREIIMGILIAANLIAFGAVAYREKKSKE